MTVNLLKQRRMWIEGALFAVLAGGCTGEAYTLGLDGAIAGDSATAGCIAAPEECDQRDNDCDGDLDEDFDFMGSLEHCGACNAVCGSTRAAPSCVQGVCKLECASGFADCDGDAANGCEANLSSAAHCGSCGNACDSRMPLCANDGDGSIACASQCPPESQQCGQSCIDVSSHLAHCGGCNQACDPANAIGICEQGRCAVVQCHAGWADCDGEASNGCEANLGTSQHCGACGNTCTPERPLCVSVDSGFQCSDGCGNGIRDGDEADVDCGGSRCAPCASGQRCQNETDCADTLACRAGRCEACGVCVPGETQNESCGGCGAGSRLRTCTSACEWGAWSACSGSPVCAPGEQQTESCGACGLGSRSRACTSSCAWGAWTPCREASSVECLPGNMKTESCGQCGTETVSCNGQCRWESSGVCSNQGVCRPGDTRQAACSGLCGSKTQECTSRCAWRDTSACSGGACTPGERQTESCGACGLGSRSRTCTSSCTWGLWTACAEPSTIECRPGDQRLDSCGQCGTETVFCNSQCRWQSSGVCSNQGTCDTGETRTVSCGGACGTKRQTCTSSCTWQDSSACSGTTGSCTPGSSRVVSCGGCGRGSQTQVCTSSCVWDNSGSCQEPSDTCVPGSIDIDSCGPCDQGTRTRTCSGSCRWGSYGTCDESAIECTSSSETTTTGCDPLMHRTCSTSTCTFNDRCVCSVGEQRFAGLGCPEHYYRESYTRLSSTVYTNCEPICGDSNFAQCKTGYCPSGYFMPSRSCLSACKIGSTEICDSFQPNTEACERIGGRADFAHCISDHLDPELDRNECPRGYYVFTTRYSAQCGQSSLLTPPPNQLACKILPGSGTRFTTCGSECPVGSRPTGGTSCSATRCGGCSSGPNLIECRVN